MNMATVQCFYYFNWLQHEKHPTCFEGPMNNLHHQDLEHCTGVFDGSRMVLGGQVYSKI